MNDPLEGEQEILEWEARQRHIERMLEQIVHAFQTLTYLMVAVLIAFTVRGAFDILLFQHQDDANQTIGRQNLVVCDLYKRLHIQPPVGACPSRLPHSADGTVIVLAILAIVAVLVIMLLALHGRSQRRTSSVAPTSDPTTGG